MGSIFPQEVQRQAIKRVLEEQSKYPSQWAAMRAIAPEIGCTAVCLQAWVRRSLRQFIPSQKDLPNEGKLEQPPETPTTPSLPSVFREAAPRKAPKKTSEELRAWREHRTEEMLDRLHELQQKSQAELLRRLDDDGCRAAMSDNLLNALHGTVIDKIAMKERWQSGNADAGGEFIGNLAAGLMKVLASGASVKLEIGTSHGAMVDVTPRSKPLELESVAQAWREHRTGQPADDDSDGAAEGLG